VKLFGEKGGSIINVGMLMRSALEKCLISQTLLGRFGRPEDIAPVAVFLSSEASRITGEIIRASGGIR
jgi:3-oxoacyl-[acyl-carrier protein] reductase